jgi:hypothetical protein
MVNLDADRILLASLVFAFVFVLVRAVRGCKFTLFWIIPGKGKFDVKASWVANTTVFGAILGSPVKDMGPSGAINSLNVLFLALGAVAVLLQLLGTRSGKDPMGQETYQMPVWSYLLAALVAFWAAAGQLLTLGQMIRDAKREVISTFAEVVFLGSVALAALILAIYVWKMMGRHLEAALSSEDFAKQDRGFEERYPGIDVYTLDRPRTPEGEFLRRTPSGPPVTPERTVL